MATSSMLVGRLALVTGGGSGIGRAVCQVFCREGAQVIVADRNEASARETVHQLPGGLSEHMAASVDVSVSQSVHALLKQAIARYSRPPCIVVNSAGITRDNFTLKMDEKAFDDVIDVNLKGTFLVTQTAAAAMVEAKISPASIVNIGSISGKYGNVGQANYSASKAGVEGLTRTFSKEFARHGIRCNVIIPGFIETPMTEVVPQKVKEKLIPVIPMGRMGRPEEVAQAILFLASERSSYITGTSIEVSGGMF